MHKNHLLLWVFVFLAVAIIFAGLVGLNKWNKPLGESLDLPTYTPGTPVPISPASHPASSNPANPGSTGEALVPTTPWAPSVAAAVNDASPAPTSHPLCGGPANLTILAIGSDQRGTGYLYGLADSIHIVRIDFTVPNIMVIDFPRDLWVEIPGISDHYGITHGKLNQAYLYGNPGMGYYDGPGDGPGLLARTLDLNFGLRVDHYVAIDTQTFVHFINAVGGVDITVDSPIDLHYGMVTPDPRYFLPEGTQHLDGDLALVLATNRIPTTFQRMKYQKMILSALREKLLTPDILPKFPKLAAQFIGSIQTDLSPREIDYLLCIVQLVPTGNIKADSFPQDMFTADVAFDKNGNVNRFVYDADFDQLRAMIAEFMRGVWPMP